MTGASLLGPRDGHWLAGRDPRLLILALVLFAIVTVSLRSLTAAAGAFALATTAAAAGGLPLRDLARRLLALEGLMVVVLLTLPFTVPGEALLALGPFTATREGALGAALIVLKANAVVLALLGLVGSLEPAVLGHALARLGVPAKLVHLLLLTVRQIEVLHQELLRLRQAMRARAFVARSDRHTWTSYGNLVGMLLVRSLERSRRILTAMRCRGFHGRLYLLDVRRWRAADTAFLLGLLPLLAGLLALDRLP
jgi:cobalt/nickel transport system permease protein